MADHWAIEAAGLTKTYGSKKILDQAGLRVAPGTVFSLLGPNGAGKTTMVRILSTLLRPDGGRARVAGFDIIRDRRQVRRSISLTGQYAALDGLLTGAENLRMMARLSGLRGAAAGRRADELLARFGLTEAGRRRVATYSGGLRRRLDLAASLVGHPAVIFLDEPTTGLDLPSRQVLWQVIEDLAGSGVTVFLTTQYLEEADRLSGRVAVLDAGRIVAEGTTAELKDRVAGQRLDLTLAGPGAFAEAERRLGERATLRDPPALTLGVPTDGTAPAVRALLDEIDPERALVGAFAVRATTLDDVFLALTGPETGPGPSREETLHA
ncbi:MAG: ATP-binding cassette domain-containing protein [Streptosporangiaceae bacterium]